MSEQSPVLNIQGVLNIFKMAAFVETVLPLSLVGGGFADGRHEVSPDSERNETA